MNARACTGPAVTQRCGVPRAHGLQNQLLLQYSQGCVGAHKAQIAHTYQCGVAATDSAPAKEVKPDPDAKPAAPATQPSAAVEPPPAAPPENSFSSFLSPAASNSTRIGERNDIAEHGELEVRVRAGVRVGVGIRVRVGVEVRVRLGLSVPGGISSCKARRCGRMWASVFDSGLSVSSIERLVTTQVIDQSRMSHDSTARAEATGSVRASAPCRQCLLGHVVMCFWPCRRVDGHCPGSRVSDNRALPVGRKQRHGTCYGGAPACMSAIRAS